MALPGPPSPTPTASIQPAYWELRALHHFAVVTSHSLPGSHIPSVQDCWSVYVPKLALEYEPLLNTLFALAASHLIHAGCKDPGLLDCRAKYLGAALPAHRQALGNLTAVTAEAACFTSILLLVDTFAALQGRPLSPYEPPIQWLRIVRGARTVFEASRSLIRSQQKNSESEPVSGIMILAQTSVAYSGPSAVSGSEADRERFSYILPDRVSNASASVDGDGDGDGSTSDNLHVYREVAGYIGSMHTAVQSSEHPLALCRRLLSFACLVPERFLELVEELQPHAITVLAHLFALSAHAEKIWWIGDTPFKEVHAIKDCTPCSLSHLLDFPLQVLESVREH